MVCLPLEFVYGWIFTINPKNVASTAKQFVTKYKQECYHALYEHFTGSMRRTIETNQAEIDMLNQLNTSFTEEREAKNRRKAIERELDRLRAERLNPQPTLF